MPISAIDVTLVYPDSRRDRIRLREKALNQGADGLIYAAPDGKLALKLYHNPEKDPERPEKIRQMLQAPPDDNGLEHFAWPVAQAVNRNGRFIGYAMPLLPLGEYESLELLLTRKGRRLAGLPESRTFRIKAAENLARRVAQLHDKGHCVIDMKPANLLVNRKTADIVVVDCDGFAIQGQHSFIPGHQYTPGYIASEAWKNRVEPEALGKAQDLFALAVIIFQLVNEGLHPYQGVPGKNQNIPSDTQSRIGEGLYPYGKKKNARIKPSPWSLHSDFPVKLQQTFDQAFHTGRKRPDAQAWVGIISVLANELKECETRTYHSYWGSDCPICNLNSITIKVKSTNRQAAPGNTRRPVHGGFQPPPAPGASSHTVAAQTPQSVSRVRVNNLLGLLLGAIVVGVSFFAYIATYAPPQEPERAVTHTFSSAEKSTPGESEAGDRVTSSSWKERESWRWRITGTKITPVNIHRSKFDFIFPQGFQPVGGNIRAREQSNIRLPYFEAGEFSSFRNVPVLLYSPLPPFFNYSGTQSITATNLSIEQDVAETGSDFPVTELYQLRDGFMHPKSKALYLRKCGYQVSCHELARLTDGGQLTVFPVEEEPENDGSGMRQLVRSWHFAVSRDENHVALAGSKSIRIHSAKDPGMLIAEASYPSSYSDFQVADLSITPDADRLFVGLYQYRQHSLEYEATILEYRFRDGEIQLVTDFRSLWPKESSSIPAPSVSVSDNGRTLVIGENADLLTDTSTYRQFGSPAAVKTAYPGIRIWKASEGSDNWVQTGHFQLKRRNRIKTPENPAMLTNPFSSQPVIGTHSFNLDFKLSPDGQQILSGIEHESESREVTTARAWVLTLQNGEPKIKARIEQDLTNPDLRIYSVANYFFANMSADGSEVIMGVSQYKERIPLMSSDTTSLTLSVAAFTLEETDPPTPPADTESLTTR